MTDTEKNEIISTAYKTVESFIQDWQHEPYKWNLEIDIQVDLTSRIKDALKVVGKDELYLSYKTDIIREFRGERQKYSRVCCEYSTYYNWEIGDGNSHRYACNPDIIIVDDPVDVDNLPDVTPLTNFPMLWVCEIKYRTEYTSDNKENKKWDKDKMLALLNQQKDVVLYGCCINLSREISKDSQNFNRTVDERNNRLVSYAAKVPMHSNRTNLTRLELAD